MFVYKSRFSKLTLSMLQSHKERTAIYVERGKDVKRVGSPEERRMRGKEERKKGEKREQRNGKEESTSTNQKKKTRTRARALKHKNRYE